MTRQRRRGIDERIELHLNELLRDGLRAVGIILGPEETMELHGVMMNSSRYGGSFIRPDSLMWRGLRISTSAEPGIRIEINANFIDRAMVRNARARRDRQRGAAPTPVPVDDGADALRYSVMAEPLRIFRESGRYG